ncbi:pyridoxal-phosphate dependent enzyme, partial [Clostridium saudiense]|nr:pyridoxal-phosphate dependent enzyme [Clostridium saudiense]
SFKNKKLTSLNSVNTIADGIAVKTPGDKTFEIIRENVDEIITVSDSEIVDAFLLLTEKHKLIAEASGVVSLAALKKLNITGKKICSVISGGNIDMLTISTLINNGLVSGGRLFCFSTEVPNTPGQLLKLSQLLTKENANIVSLDHDKFKATNRINNVLVEITVETNGNSHIDQIVTALEKEGYSIRVMY